MRIGIDMGGMSVKFGLVNTENEIVEKLVIPTRLDIPAREMIQDMIAAVKKLLHQANMAIKDCDGIGIASPGTVDDRNGMILYSNNFDWEKIPIIDQMKEVFPVPMAIANDADAAALGEVKAGAATGCRSAVMITLGTGVGGGVIQDGKIFHGPLKGGMELGHMVIQAGGEPCTCGRKGCLECYASATALLRMARLAVKKNPDSLMNKMCGGNLENINGIIPFEAAMKGDRAAGEVIGMYEDYLAIGIANVINIFRPEKIILGGGVCAQGENLTKPVEELVKKYCFGGAHGEIASIVTARLGNDAGIIGAANLII